MLKVTFHANIYGPLDGGNGYITTLPVEVFTQKNSVADFIRLKLNFIFKKQKNCLSNPSGDIGVTYALHL